jgi:hypothetical protein
MSRANRLSATAGCLTASLLPATLLCACVNEDPAPVVIDVDYQVRCLDCVPRAPDEPPHDVTAVTGGKHRYRVTCTGDEYGDAKTIAFALDTNELQVNGNQGFGLAIRQALPGPDPGPSCRVNAREGVNRYEGRCSADDPTDEIPCQVVMDWDDDLLAGTLLCRNIRDEAGAYRSIVASGSDEPAEFTVHGCPRP